ncbi:MAG: metallophosphoesterase, partial [Leptospirales bacterium]|nr:metallophosphoesterase [Leptospirales bacterium]
HFAIEDRRISAPVRIAHITDLQTDGIGPMHWQARQQLRSFQPDLIVFTGDVLNHPRLIPEVADFLHSLAAPGRSYLIRGDHDAGLPGASFAARSGFRWFDGQSEIITIRGAQLKLIGLGRPDMRHMATVDLLTRPRRAGEAQLYTIVLSHPPDALFAAERRGVDLLIAGHTHGGQIALPFFGPPLTLTRAPRRIGAGGLHRYGRLEVLVSRGLGMEGHVAPRIRFLCRPQLSLLELRPASSAH